MFSKKRCHGVTGTSFTTHATRRTSPLRAELAKVGIQVEKAPSPPFGRGHLAEDGVRYTLKGSLGLAKPAQKVYQLLSIRGEFERNAAATTLLHLGASGDATGPMHREPQCKPFHDRPLKNARG